MKAIINWIILIPVLVLAVGVELFAALSPESAQSFFGMDTNGISEIILIAIVVLFALFFLLSLFDRKTSPVHILKHNYAAGICGVIAAFSLAGDTASKVAEGIRGTGLGAMDIILAVVSAVAAVAMLLVGINHCTANNTKNAASLLYLAIPLWCAVHLLSRFMTHTAEPVAMADTMDLVMYVFLAIFFMYAMMVVSLINGKNPVKAAIYWGAPAAVASLVYSVSVVGEVLNSKGTSVFAYLDAITCGFLGLYILSFIAELSFMSKTKEEQYVLEAEAEEDSAEEEPAEAHQASAFVSEEITVNQDEAVEADAVETEINQTMKKYFDDISSVESEIPEDDDIPTEDEAPAEEQEPKKDYGSYFDTEETEDMYIESENIAVDTTKKHAVDKSKYPAAKEETTHQFVAGDEYVVGLDQVGESGTGKVVREDISDYVLNKTAKETVEDNIKAKDSYEARLDEIDRLIISIQGGDSDEK